MKEGKRHEANDWKTEAANEAISELVSFVCRGGESDSRADIERAGAAIDTLRSEIRANHGPTDVFSYEQKLIARAQTIVDAWETQERVRVATAERERQLLERNYDDRLRSLADAAEWLNETDAPHGMPTRLPHAVTEDEVRAIGEGNPIEMALERQRADANRAAHGIDEYESIRKIVSKALTASAAKRAIRYIEARSAELSACYDIYNANAETISAEMARRAKMHELQKASAEILADPASVVADLQRQIDELRA